jgi:hypothetical protein
MKTARNMLLLLFGILASVVVASWPLAWKLEDFLILMSEPRDFHCGAWIPWNFLQQTKAAQSGFLAPDMYWPDGFDTTLYFWNLGVPALQTPFFLLTHALRAMALSFLFLSLLNGLAGYVLGKVVGQGSRLAGLAGAIVLVTSTYSWNELLDGRAEPSLLVFVALAVAGLFVLVRDGGRWPAVATGLAMAAAGICYWFHGYFLAIVAISLVAWGLLRRRLDRPALTNWLLAGLVAVLVTLPFAIPILLAIIEPGSAYAQGVQGVGPPGDPQAPRVLSWVTLNSLCWPLNWQDPRMPANMVSVSVKLLLLLGIVWGSVRRRAGWLVWVGVAALILSLGPELYLGHDAPVTIAGHRVPLPFAALYALPGFDRLWWPNRWLVICQVAAAGIAAASVASLPRSWMRYAVLATVYLPFMLECQIPLQQQVAARGPQPGFEPHPFLHVLAQEPGEHPLVQMPLHNTGFPLWMAYHLQPVAGGIADGEPVLMPPEFRRRLAEVPVLSALDRVSKGEEGGEPALDVERELCDLGFHYLLLWRRNLFVPGTEVQLYRLMKRRPDRVDPILAVWRLEPCAADAPLAPRGSQ